MPGERVQSSEKEGREEKEERKRRGCLEKRLTFSWRLLTLSHGRKKRDTETARQPGGLRKRQRYTREERLGVRVREGQKERENKSEPRAPWRPKSSRGTICSPSPFRLFSFFLSFLSSLFLSFLFLSVCSSICSFTDEEERKNAVSWS